MKTSTCCKKTAVQSLYKDQYFCGGVDGCGKWCEWVEDEQSNPLSDEVYFLKHTPYYRLYDVLYDNEDASKAFLEYVKAMDKEWVDAIKKLNKNK